MSARYGPPLAWSFSSLMVLDGSTAGRHVTFRWVHMEPSWWGRIEPS